MRGTNATQLLHHVVNACTRPRLCPCLQMCAKQCHAQCRPESEHRAGQCAGCSRAPAAALRVRFFECDVHSALPPRRDAAGSLCDLAWLPLGGRAAVLLRRCCLPPPPGNGGAGVSSSVFLPGSRPGSSSCGAAGPLAGSPFPPPIPPRSKSAATRRRGGFLWRLLGRSLGLPAVRSVVWSSATLAAFRASGDAQAFPPDFH